MAAASVTSEEKPYGVRIESGGHALRGDEPVAHGGVDVELSYMAPDRSNRWIDLAITLHGPLDDDHRARLAEIAEKTPVTKVVRAGTEIRTTLRATP